MKSARYLLYVLAAALFVWCVAGCAATEHALNLATLDDIEGTRADQHHVDLKQSQVVQDVLTGAAQPADIVPATQTAIAKADVDYRARTPPPTPGGGPDWNVLIPATLAGIATILGATAHVKANNNTKSLAETDKWVGDVEKKVDPTIKA